MIERLDQLKLKDLIELSCGDYSVLIEHDEVPTVEEFTSCTARIMAEYKFIASPVQAKMELADVCTNPAAPLTTEISPCGELRLTLGFYY